MPDPDQPSQGVLRQQPAPVRLCAGRLRQQPSARHNRLMRRWLAALWLPMLAAAVTGCGGSVAEGGASTTSAPPAAVSAPAGCTKGADSTVHDRGQPDNFNSTATAPFTKQPDGLQYTDLVA